MATHNTGSDAANTMIRAFLTKVGESYLGHGFNTRSGKGKIIWERIKNDTFQNSCAFCGDTNQKLTIEHLVMFNRDQCGLHHPGNVVPCCSDCNSRGQHSREEYFHWTEQLEVKCATIVDLRLRKQKILSHIEDENYPSLTEDEINALKAVAQNLYERVSSELQKSLTLFENIDATLVKRR